MIKKQIFTFLALLLMSTGSVMAQGTEPSGSGTSGDPYKIATKDNLLWLSQNSSADWSVYYEQTANIVFDDADFQVDGDFYNGGAGFSPIGSSSTAFTGEYDGQNYSIDNLYINRSTNDNIGLFGYVTDGTIKNLIINNADITGKLYTGVLCGYVEVSSSSIDNCETSGSLSATAQCGGMIGRSNCPITNSSSSVTVTAGETGSAPTWSDAGGLIGDAGGTITNCYATGNVTTDGRNAGGLVGWVEGDLIIEQSFATGNVTINSSSSSPSGEAGGLVGSYSGNSSQITNSYATGTISVDYSSNGGVGGLIGQLTDDPGIENCYFSGEVTNTSGNIGGFIGEFEYGTESPTLANNFWNNSINSSISGIGNDSNNGVTGKSTTEMTTQSTFTDAGWDFINETANGSDDVWAMSSSITFNGYPTLQWSGAYSEAPSGSPYQIASLPNLVWITENDTRWSNSYIQTADINAWTTPSWDDGKGWTPIGFSSQDFTGSYDGDGYTIDNLYINRPSDDEVALFSDTDDADGGATITNLGVTNVDITGDSYVGGLVGWHGTGCTVSYSYTTGSVYGERDGSGGNYVGGIIGYINGGTISNSYSTASVSGYRYIGGLVGQNSSGTIKKCYAIGSVSGTYDTGGLVGNNSFGDVNDSFWDTETTGQLTSSGGGTGKTTAEMQRATTFLDAGWVFTLLGDIWAMNQDVNSGYPFLRMEGDTPAHVWLGSAKSTDWGTAGNWSENSTPGSANNVIIPDVTNNPAISNDISSPALSDKLTIEPAAVLTVSAGDALTVNSDLSNSGTLSINSSSSATGSLIVDGTVSGDVTVERYIEGHGGDNSTGWHLLSTPVNSFAINGSNFDPGTGTNDDFYSWSESSYLWLNYKAGGFSNMNAGTGYLVSYETNSTKNFTGTLNNSDITHSNLSVSPDNGNGWHLLGNPFPSALHWTESADWNITNFAPGAKIMNSGGSYTDISTGGNQYIPAHQGFFVQATTDASNSITIPRADRTHDATSFYKSEVNNLLTLKASQGNKYVETWLQMKAGATVNYDEAYDIRFLGGMQGTPYLYSICDNDEYVSTNRIPEDINDTEIPLGFSVTNDGEITLEWKNLDSFENDVDISLTDLKTEKTISLDETDRYTFTATTGDDVNRFMLNFKSAIGIDEPGNELEGVSIYSHNHRIFVNSGDELTNADISVYNPLGQLVRQESYKSGDKVISVDQTGAFIVRIQADEGIATEKVIIH